MYDSLTLTVPTIEKQGYEIYKRKDHMNYRNNCKVNPMAIEGGNPYEAPDNVGSKVQILEHNK